MDPDVRPLPFNSRTLQTRTLVGAALVLVAIGFALGYFSAARSAAASAAGAPQDVDFGPVWKAWQVIEDKFVPASVATTTPVASSTAEADQRRVWGMIEGLAESLGDPYTFFLPPVENKQFAEDLSGAFEGVGMEIAVKDKILTVVSPIRGAPAEAAGIKSGDRIVRINGEETQGMDISEAVSKIRGPKGSIVALLLMREGWTEPREIKVVRDVIDVPLVNTELRPDGVFVIELLSFTANSPELFRSALREFIESRSDKLILDLRGNPGGYLEASVDMASYFLPSGRTIVVEDYAGNSPNVTHRSRGYDVFNDNLKMVILVDRGSASASEILAGALQHWGVAKLVGERTFGKGSVQELVDITRDTALKLTVARWVTPSGDPIPLEGIKPDVEVELTDEDREADRDPQLERAVAIVKEMQ